MRQTLCSRSFALYARQFAITLLYQINLRRVIRLQKYY
jgi:hypothetical protein